MSYINYLHTCTQAHLCVSNFRGVQEGTMMLYWDGSPSPGSCVAAQGSDDEIAKTCLMNGDPPGVKQNRCGTWPIYRWLTCRTWTWWFSTSMLVCRRVVPKKILLETPPQAPMHCLEHSRCGPMTRLLFAKVSDSYTCMPLCSRDSAKLQLSSQW